MSRAKDRIVRQAESQGWTVTRIEWESLGIVMEKAGQEGGWDVYLQRGTTEEWAGGYNVEQVLEWIRNLDRPLGERTDPFACSGKRHSLVAGDCVAGRGHKGDHFPFVPPVPASRPATDTGAKP